MGALSNGVRAPEVELADLSGQHFSLAEQRKRGPVVLVFFKISCPVCQYTLPFFERLHQNHPTAAIYGVSQNGKSDTERFCREFGVTFPVLLDEPKTYRASNAYQITNVPTFFLVSSDGEIEISSVGWSKGDMESIARKLGAAAQAAPAMLFKPGEQVADFRAG